MATILIVDDLATNRAFLVKLLRNQGHRLIEAANGSLAMAVFKAEPVDLVITDVLMPVMDGYEFVRQLRLDPATSKLPVLFYTAPYSEREARAFALSSDVPYVLRKPAEPDEVLTVVARVLAGTLEPGAAPYPPPPKEVAKSEHLRLLTATLSEKFEDLRAANVRLRALINIGLDLGAERDPDQLLHHVCLAALDLFGATYVTLGIIDPEGHTVQRFSTMGLEAATWIRTGDPVPGVLARVITERHPFRGRNPGGDPAGLQLPAGHPAIHAVLAAPIVSPARVYGWLCLVDNDGAEFAEGDEELVMALCGQLGRIYELAHEIGERRQAESAVRHERDLSQRYLDTAEVILLALDLEGRITLVNRHACSVLGWEASDLLGRNFITTCVPAHLREETGRRLRRVHAGPDSSQVDNPIVTRSGEERLIQWRNTLLRDGEGRVVSTLSSGTDITGHTQAIDALRTAEERMRFALQGANVGIWDMDYATGVVRWSEVLEAQYGLQPGTFGGTFDAFMDRVHPDDRTVTLEAIQRAGRLGTDFTILNRSLWADGTVRWLSGTGRILLGSDGKPERGIGISQDITDRRKLEAQQLQGQKMEAIGQLASGVAHDFNNLLTVILGCAELMSADSDRHNGHGEDIGEIIKAAKRAAGLTKQLLAFSRQQVLLAAPLDVNRLIRDMTGMLGRLIGVNIDVTLALGPDLSLAFADKGQVEQVVMNLVVNARDAMPGGGTVTIETADVELEASALRAEAVVEGEYVMIAITDTGSGMSKEIQRRIFDPFFTTKETGKGTGLGLSTTYGIVKQSLGYIWVYSEPGHGTTFKVYLPRNKPAASTAAAGPAVMAPGGNGTKTLLLVDDESGVRKLSRRILDKAGYHVLEAANGEDAERMFAHHADEIDLVVTDLMMPDCEGPELFGRLRLKVPGLRVLYVSGYTEASAARKTGIDRGLPFVQKPFTAAELVRQVRRALDE